MARFNIIEAIRARADAAAVALVQGSQNVSYHELLQRCDAVAEQLPRTTHALRIGVHYPSGIDYVPIAMGVLAAGHCFVPMPDELAPAERAELIRRTALDGMIVAVGEGFEARWLRDRIDRTDGIDGGEGFAALNAAFIRFSSGTTGVAKGVVLSHESLLARVQAANAGLGIGAADRVLWVLPMAHHFAVSIMLYLYHGATTVIAEQHLGADLLHAGAEHQITVMYGSPTHYRQLVACAGDTAWPQLRLAVSTAAALDRATAERFAARFGKPLVQGLGIIEVGLPLLNLDAPIEACEAVGKPLPAYSAMLRDEHDGIGELCLRGPGMFDAYLDPWQPREEEWFATGDLASMDAEGRITLRGRCKSVINLGGMKIFPEEVERVLDAHPRVRRSLVSSRLHDLYGEVPMARFIAEGEAPSSGELRAYCREHLAAYKIPALFTVVESLPTTANGKLIR